jgi:CheY-like chemotaxis protein
MTNPDTILIAEDEPGDVVLIQRAFAKARIANPLQIARDGEQAVAYLAGSGEYADRARYPLPAVMLLDLKMPRKSGLEVLTWLRLQPGLSRLRVVVLTSSRESPDVNRAHDLGISSYLVKPVEHNRLVDMMTSLNLFLVVYSEAPDLNPG